MHAFAWLFFLHFPVAASVPEPPPELPPLLLQTGEQRLLRVPGLLRYTLSGDSARSMAPPGRTGDALLIKGLRPGFSDLWVWKQDGSSEHRSIQVEKTRLREAPRALETALARLTEAEIIPSGAGITLRGELKSLREAARVASIARAFPKEISDETEASEELLREGQSLLERWIRAGSFADRLRVERFGRSVWVRGHARQETEAAAIRKQAAAVFPRAEVELSALPDGAPTVHFRVYLLEMRRSRFGTLGLSWPESIPGAFHVNLGALREALSLELAIQALEGEGSAKVLSQPELVVRAPGEAELFAGGEIPVRASSLHKTQVSWKPYGLTLKLKITHVAGDRVRLEIATEVSSLNPQVIDDPVPGLQANRMRTQVDARFGEPLLLSGLLQEGTREQARGLPLLRRIPVLGKLFGSEDYLNERSELVAILLPRSSPPPPSARLARISGEPKLPAPSPLPEPIPEPELPPAAWPRPEFPPFSRAFGGTR